jgi:hypothetical protein
VQGSKEKRETEEQGDKASRRGTPEAWTKTPGAKRYLVGLAAGLGIGGLLLFYSLEGIVYPSAFPVPYVVRTGADPVTSAATARQTLAALGLTVFVLGILAAAEGRRRYTELLERQLKGEVDDAVGDIKGPDDVMGFVRANRKQMQCYDALARSQASSAHIATLGAGIAGLLAVGAGLLVAVTADAAASKYAAAIIAAVGTATGGFIATTFIRVQESAMEQMRYYFQQPLIQSYLLCAERLLTKLDDNDRPAETKTLIAAAIAQTTDMKKLASPPATGSANPERHRRRVLRRGVDGDCGSDQALTQTKVEP